MTIVERHVIKRKKLMGIVFLLIFFIFSPVYFLGAQGPSLSDISLEITPTLPSAFEKVGANIRGNVDLSRADISWYVNDTLILSGTGATTAEFSTGAFGSLSQVRVIINSITGDRIVKNLSIRPAEVNILWSAHSYTPPFYKGKALAPSAGLITLTAMPEFVDRCGKRLDPNELFYTWSERGVVLGNTSGYGKQQIVLQNATVPQRPLVVNVVVSTFDKSIEAGGNARISVYDPEIFFYERNPLQGVLYERELSTIETFAHEEITVRGEPFYFSLDDILKGSVRYRWRINGEDIAIPLTDQTNNITLRREGSVDSRADISLEIDNFNLPFRALQTAEKFIRLNLSS